VFGGPVRKQRAGHVLEFCLVAAVAGFGLQLGKYVSAKSSCGEDIHNSILAREATVP